MIKSTLVKGEYIDGPRESLYVNASCPECGIIFQKMTVYTYCPEIRVLLCSERCHVSYHYWLTHGDGSGSDGGSDEQEQDRGDGGGVEIVSDKYTNEGSMSSVWHSRDVSSYWDKDRS